MFDADKGDIKCFGAFISAFREKNQCVLREIEENFTGKLNLLADEL